MQYSNLSANSEPLARPPFCSMIHRASRQPRVAFARSVLGPRYRDWLAGSKEIHKTGSALPTARPV